MPCRKFDTTVLVLWTNLRLPEAEILSLCQFIHSIGPGVVLPVTDTCRSSVVSVRRQPLNTSYQLDWI